MARGEHQVRRDERAGADGAGLRLAIATTPTPENITALLAPDLLALFEQQRNAAAAARDRQLAQRVAGTRPSLPLSEYVGTYRHVTYGDAVVTLRGDALQVKFGSAYDGPLTHWQHDVFRVRWLDRQNGEASITFRPDGTGRIAAAQLLGLTFNRVPAAR